MGAREDELEEAELELEKMVEFKERAKRRGYGNVSNDALFIASELRDTRNMLVTVMLSGFGVLAGIGVAILALL